MKIAVIGNADTLKGYNLAKFIDSCDVVVRINYGYLPECLDNDRGHKTTVVYHCSTARKRISPGFGITKHCVNSVLREELHDLYGAQPTSGILAAIDYANKLKEGDHIFIGGISFFEKSYIENYHGGNDVLEANRNNILSGKVKVHNSVADRESFKFCLLNNKKVILDPWLSEYFKLPYQKDLIHSLTPGI